MWDGSRDGGFGELGVQGTQLWDDMSVGRDLSAPGLGGSTGQHLQVLLQPRPSAFGAHLCCLEKILLYPCFIVT